MPADPKSPRQGDGEIARKVAEARWRVRVAIAVVVAAIALFGCESPPGSGHFGVPPASGPYPTTHPSDRLRWPSPSG